MTEPRKDDEIKVRLPAGLKAEAMKALKATTSDRRGVVPLMVVSFTSGGMISVAMKYPPNGPRPATYRGVARASVACRKSWLCDEFEEQFVAGAGTPSPGVEPGTTGAASPTYSP